MFWSAQKDVAEFRDLLDRLDDVTSNLEMRTKEVEELRRQVITQDNYVMQSAPMKEVEKNHLEGSAYRCFLY